MADAAIRLPVTLSTAPKDKPRLGLAFTYEGERLTVTESYWRDGQGYYGLSYRADKLGPWREVTDEELAAMLEVACAGRLASDPPGGVGVSVRVPPNPAKGCRDGVGRGAVSGLLNNHTPRRA